MTFRFCARFGGHFFVEKRRRHGDRGAAVAA